MKLAKHVSIAALGAGAALWAGTASADTAECNGGDTILMAEIGWESGAFETAVISELLSSGYGCDVETLPGTSITLEQALALGDIDLTVEEWLGRSPIWDRAEEAGQVVGIGNTFSGAREGWFIPRYMVEGDAERGVDPIAPDLRSVAQLNDPKIAALFRDPEDPSRGRFLNCPSGWTCEKINTAKLTAYEMNDTYVNFRPGTGSALDAAISSAYLRAEPILFYYWEPTAIMARYDLIKLEEPEYSESCWAGLIADDAEPVEACAYPESKVVYGLNKEFAESVPQVVDMLGKAEFPIDVINGSLDYMESNDVKAPAAALEFLRSRKGVWEAWVTPDAAERISAAIAE